MKRRSLILGVAASSTFASSWPAPVQAQAAEADYEDVLGPFPVGLRPFGTHPALGPEDATARKILSSAPKGGDPLATARYFAGLTETNSEQQAYNAQWPVRWNPVIVGFYQSTDLAKTYIYRNGDTIAWCAAFVNWCLDRNGYKTTDNALSGSFRLGKGLGKPTDTPKPGDIIVFRSADPKAAAVGHGHVAFFVSSANGGFNVLGGNQRHGKKYSSVNAEFFPTTSDALVFDSIRSLSTIGKRSAG